MSSINPAIKIPAASQTASANGAISSLSSATKNAVLHARLLQGKAQIEAAKILLDIKYESQKKKAEDPLECALAPPNPKRQVQGPKNSVGSTQISCKPPADATGTLPMIMPTFQPTTQTPRNSGSCLPPEPAPNSEPRDQTNRLAALDAMRQTNIAQFMVPVCISELLRNAQPAEPQTNRLYTMILGGNDFRILTAPTSSSPCHNTRVGMDPRGTPYLVTQFDNTYLNPGLHIDDTMGPRVAVKTDIEGINRQIQKHRDEPNQPRTEVFRRGNGIYIFEALVLGTISDVARRVPTASKKYFYRVIMAEAAAKLANDMHAKGMAHGKPFLENARIGKGTGEFYFAKSYQEEIAAGIHSFPSPTDQANLYSAPGNPASFPTAFATDVCLLGQSFLLQLLNGGADAPLEPAFKYFRNADGEPDWRSKAKHNDEYVQWTKKMTNTRGRFKVEELHGKTDERSRFWSQLYQADKEATDYVRRRMIVAPPARPDSSQFVSNFFRQLIASTPEQTHQAKQHVACMAYDEGLQKYIDELKQHLEIMRFNQGIIDPTAAHRS